jgi:hypothetical protein
MLQYTGNPEMNIILGKSIMTLYLTLLERHALQIKPCLPTFVMIIKLSIRNFM